MSKIWLTTAFLFIALIGSGQVFEGGIIIGPSANQIDGDYNAGYNKLGYEFNVFSVYHLNKILSLQSGITLIQKGAHSSPKAFYFKTVIDEIEVPLWLNIKPYPHLGASVGMNWGYIYKAYYLADIYMDKQDLSIGNLDWSYYLALTYAIGKKVTFRLANRYSLLPITRPIRLECWKTSIFLSWISAYPVTQTPCWWTNTMTVSFEFKLF